MNDELTLDGIERIQVLTAPSRSPERPEAHWSRLTDLPGAGDDLRAPSRFRDRAASTAASGLSDLAGSFDAVHGVDSPA